MNLDDRLRDLLQSTGDQLSIDPAGADHVQATAHRRTQRNRIAAGVAAVVAVAGIGTATLQLTGGGGADDDFIAGADLPETAAADGAPLEASPERADDDPTTASGDLPGTEGEVGPAGAEESFGDQTTELAQAAPIVVRVGDDVVRIAGRELQRSEADGSFRTTATLPEEITSITDVAVDGTTLVVLGWSGQSTTPWLALTDDLTGWRTIEVPAPDLPGGPAFRWSPAWSAVTVGADGTIVVGGAFYVDVDGLALLPDAVAADLPADAFVDVYGGPTGAQEVVVIGADGAELVRLPYTEVGITPELAAAITDGVGAFALVDQAAADGGAAPTAVADGSLPRSFDLAATTDGYVATGWVAGTDVGPGVFTSPDGRSWSRTDVTLRPTDTVERVLAAGDTVVVTGLSGADPFVLRSNDGGGSFVAVDLATVLDDDTASWVSWIEHVTLSPDGRLALLVQRTNVSPDQVLVEPGPGTGSDTAEGSVGTGGTDAAGTTARLALVELATGEWRLEEVDPELSVAGLVFVADDVVFLVPGA